MIFVTGGTGLLGTHVLIELLSRGKKVRALKRPNSDLETVRKVFQYYLQSKADAFFDQIEWVNGDVNDLMSLRDSMTGCEVVYHCAAMVSFSKKDLRRLIKVNKEGTANVVNTALSLGIDHLVYVSSTAAIGHTEGKEIFDESDKWFRAKHVSNYSVSKYLAEMEVWRGAEEGLPAVIVNPSLIFGAGNWSNSSISIFKVVKNGLKFYTPGGNSFVDARDVARIMTSLSEQRIFNDRFLIVSENVLYKTLFNQIAAAFGIKGPSILTKPWMASIAWRWESFLRICFGRKQNITKETARSAMKVTKYSNQKIKDKLNYQFIPLEDSVMNAVEFFQK